MKTAADRIQLSAECIAVEEDRKDIEQDMLEMFVSSPIDIVQGIVTLVATGPDRSVMSVSNHHDIAQGMIATFVENHRRTQRYMAGVVNKADCRNNCYRSSDREPKWEHS